MAGQNDVYSNGKAAASELGQVNLVTTSGANRGGSPAANTLSDPSSIAVDPISGKVFVADSGNNRVLRYLSTSALTNGAAAEAVLGQGTLETTAGATTLSRFSDPKSICCDSEGRLWVLDGNRVVRFDNAGTIATGANANGVLGQTDFVATAANNGQNGLGNPAAIRVSITGTLWVSSPDLNRVSRFGSAATKPNGVNADTVLGQLDFVASTAATTAAGMSSPTGLVTDLAGNLYVSDTGNHRVLLFYDADTGISGRDANVVLGQLVKTTATASAGTFGMNNPTGLAINPLGTLFVADQGNDRVLLFQSAAGRGDGGAASRILGQSALESPTALGIDRSFVSVQGLWADGNRRLWAADPGLDRVLRFETDQYQPDALIGQTPASFLGDGRYNLNGVGQSSKVIAKSLKTGRGYLRIQNDGDVVDNHVLTASPGNRFIQLAYFRTPGGNVTAAITTGRLTLTTVAPGGFTSLQIRATGTREFKLRSTSLKAKIGAESVTDGSADRVNCLILKQR